MRGRSRQSKSWEEQLYEDEDNYDDTESDNDVVLDESDLLHRYERRFPVLMVSFVGPPSARINYACMSGRDIKIYQSRMYSLEERNDDLMEFLAGILLSKPLNERSGQGKKGHGRS
ncbi:uncharacterized protein DSM5745_08428 [Aspergillus mulundensis]|uniref:Uncharacterized protein n=1 Tax=Aspergillus mulundensis TaxID=1810919 RepID=A0A3D8RA43_9EURO|nr:hypothetical protein DSM5745_08428 [Aspergillus mulundensis]RDW70917.1 hypothetical protein DSM5745_08428 [Aspergillus mulundensis]